MQEEQSVGIAGPNIIATSVPIRCQIESRSGGAPLVQMSMFSPVYAQHPHAGESL